MDFSYLFCRFFLLAGVAAVARAQPRDCSEVNGISGVYTIRIGPTRKPVEVYCDLENDDGGWLVFQRRHDGFRDFYRGWDEYASGFGDLYAEFWLGNHYLSLITEQRSYKLRVDLEDFEGETRHAEYAVFKVAAPHLNYNLTVTNYTGDAGDSLKIHNGMEFTTFDQDNDNNNGSSNCAERYQGAWWYNNCHKSNLNGLYLGGNHTQYGKGVTWNDWHGVYYSYKTSVMRLKPL